MEYQNISELTKIESLLEHFVYSTRMSEVLGVSRRSILNWKNNPDSISPDHRLDLDVLYCKVFTVPEWDKSQKEFDPVLLPDELSHNDELLLSYLRHLSYGTVEIETGMKREDFDRIMDEKRLPRNMDRATFYEGFNGFVTYQEIWKRVVGCSESISVTEEGIKSLHASLMRGVHNDAGLYSRKHRLMGRLDGVQTTAPEDIPEELNRWVYKAAASETLDEIARAHAYFILIHPFGDGNGRVGRALVMIQCLNAGLMPPLLDGKNRAIYYAAMEYAMRHGRYRPLIRLFYEAAMLYQKMTGKWQ